MIGRRFVAAAAAMSLTAISAGCASTPPSATSDDPEVAPTTGAATVDLSEEPVFTMTDHVIWLVGVLDEGEFDAAEAVERFDPSFLAQFPVRTLNAPLTNIGVREAGPWRVVEQTSDGPVAEVMVESDAGTRLTMTLALAVGAPHRIEGLILQPSQAETPEGYDFEQLDVDMVSFASDSAVGIYDVTDGACEVIHELNGDQPLAIGSIFKLWVLAALAEQIAAGDAAWGERLPVRPDLRSNPAGEVYQLDDGDTLTLREFAEAMISISDNTATDHLVDRLGRSSVEGAMAAAGVARPSLNVPFLTTRELFWLKYLADPPNPPDWYAADEQARRGLLDALDGETVPWVADPAIATAPNAEGLAQTQPRNLDIEWQASPRDVCRTLVSIDGQASVPGLEPIGEILSINPGIELDASLWPDIRFKGGSEPGVLALSWWLQRTDDRAFVIAGMWNDPNDPIDQFAATEILRRAVDLL